MGQWAYSYDRERYQGNFDTPEEAIAEAINECDTGDRIWIGEGRPPIQPEEWWDPDDWIEMVSCQDEYCGDYAEGWYDGSKEQEDELRATVQAAMADWLDRHKLRPVFYIVESPTEYRVEGARAVAVKEEVKA